MRLISNRKTHHFSTLWWHNGHTKDSSYHQKSTLKAQYLKVMMMIFDYIKSQHFTTIFKGWYRQIMWVDFFGRSWWGLGVMTMIFYYINYHYHEEENPHLHPQDWGVIMMILNYIIYHYYEEKISHHHTQKVNSSPHNLTIKSLNSMFTF